MPAFEWTKIFAAVVLASIVAVASAILATGLVPLHELTSDAYPIAAVAAPVKVASDEDAGPVPLTSDQFASADANKGSVIAHKCEACHSIGKGEPAKIGPNLWGIINNKRAHMEKLGGKWTAQNIAAFIYKPRLYLPGTKMGFPGLPDPEERADVIAYLNTQADTQIDLSKEGVAAAAAPAAPAPAAPAGGPAPGAKDGSK
jgi:cytochrome c